MNSKPKSIDMGSLIQKVTKRARELLKKKSKPQTKGKSANGTSRYSKSKRQKLLIGGVSVKLDGYKKTEILNIIGIKTPQRMSGQAHLVELLKLKTIQKIESKLLEYSENLLKIDGRTTSVYSQDEIREVAIMEKVLLDVGEKLILLKSEDHEYFKKKQTFLKEFFINANSNSQEIENRQKEIYSYKLFTGELEDYKLCNIDKEITALNIFKLFYDLTTMDEDKRKGIAGGGIYEHFQISLIGKDGEPTGGPITKVVTGDPIVKRIEAYKELLKENKETIKNIRDEFVEAGLVLPVEKKGSTAISTNEVEPQTFDRAPMTESTDLLKNNLSTIINDGDEREKFNKLLLDIKNGGKFKSITVSKTTTTKGAPLAAYRWPDTGESSIPFFIYYLQYEQAADIYNVVNALKENTPNGKKTSEEYKKIESDINSINVSLEELKQAYRDGTQTIDKLYTNIRMLITEIKKNYDYLSQKHEQYRPEKVGTQITEGALGGGNPAKYKSTGQVVHIMFQNKKYKRVIYVKEKRNTKYCKMNNEYILLSKLKVIE